MLIPNRPSFLGEYHRRLTHILCLSTISAVNRVSLEAVCGEKRKNPQRLPGCNIYISDASKKSLAQFKKILFYVLTHQKPAGKIVSVIKIQFNIFPKSNTDKGKPVERRRRKAIGPDNGSQLPKVDFLLCQKILPNGAVRCSRHFLAFFTEKNAASFR